MNYKFIYNQILYYIDMDKKTIMKTKTKVKISITSFIFSLIFGIAAFITPPIAVIDSSVLYFTAQLFLFAATLLGVNLNLGKFGNNKNKIKEEDNEDNEE